MPCREDDLTTLDDLYPQGGGRMMPLPRVRAGKEATIVT